MYREEMRVLEEEIKYRDQYLSEIYEKYESERGQEQSRLDEMARNEEVLKNEIKEKNRKMMVLEQQNFLADVSPSPRPLPSHPKASTREQFQVVLDRLRTELGEKNFELQVVNADNAILQQRLDEMSASADATDLKNRQIAEEVDRVWPRPRPQCP